MWKVDLWPDWFLIEWKWPFKVALISHKRPRLSKIIILVYTETHKPCFNSTNIKKADISFLYRKGIQIPAVQHESSTLHLLASMKIKTVEKSKQLIGAAVWRLDLTGWWRRGQLHLVITYLFSLISSAFTSYVWKKCERMIREKKNLWVIPVLRSVIFRQNTSQNMFIWGLTAKKNIPSIPIDFGKGWTYLFLSCFFQGVWPKLSPWQLTPFLWFQVEHVRCGVVNGVFVVLVQCHHLCKILIHMRFGVIIGHKCKYF